MQVDSSTSKQEGSGDALKHTLKQRHMSMIALGGVIGAGDASPQASVSSAAETKATITAAATVDSPNAAITAPAAC
mgnify:CR=1 FL=1